MIGVGWLGGFEPWVKALHIIFVIFWMAGLFMMPRFLVYHQEADLGSPEAQRWIIREQRLQRIIMDPSMVMVWALGMMLMFDIGAYAEVWFRLKLLLVAGMSAFHMWIGAYAKRLARGDASVSGRMLRLLNEVPGVATIAIVFLVILKPFSGA